MAIATFEIPKLFKPQLEFCQAKFRVTLYGGARGGGKSYVVRIKAIDLALRNPYLNILIMRRTFPELEANHIKQFKIMLEGIATYKAVDRTFYFPNGSIIKFGYMNNLDDWHQYQGQSYEVIFIDEATHFEFEMFMKLNECCRIDNTKPKKFRPRVYLTANPGGVGHTWVKRLFIDRSYLDNENPEDYGFIPAKVYDNEFIMENDPAYVKMLESLPPEERKAMLDGCWDVFEGQYFKEFNEEIHCYDPETTEIPKHCLIYRARDYGLDMTACYWAKITEDDTIYVYKGFEQPDLTVSQSGELINKKTAYDEVIYRDFCPPDMWNKNQQTGKNAVDVLTEECGQYPEKANNDREIGWLYLKEKMRINPKTNRPFLQINKNLKDLIHCLKAVQRDEKKPNDVAKTPHNITHSPDALRYLCISYASAPEKGIALPSRRPRLKSDYFMNEGEYEVVEQLENDEYYDFGGTYI